MHNQNKIVLFEGPSCVGKNTIMESLVSLHPDKYEKIVSYTTREMRDGETDGYTYHFIGTQEFLNKLESGDIFEHTTRHGTYRGNGKSIIEKIISAGKIAIKEVDIIGLHAIKKAFPNIVLSIFITADKEIVRERLINRGDKDIEVRLRDYDDIHKTINEFDYVITNNNSVDDAVKKIQNILGDL